LQPNNQYYVEGLQVEGLQVMKCNTYFRGSSLIFWFQVTSFWQNVDLIEDDLFRPHPLKRVLKSVRPFSFTLNYSSYSGTYSLKNTLLSFSLQDQTYGLLGLLEVRVAEARNAEPQCGLGRFCCQACPKRRAPSLCE
jgi:hypothetical protein